MILLLIDEPQLVKYAYPLTVVYTCYQEQGSKAKKISAKVHGRALLSRRQFPANSDYTNGKGSAIRTYRE